jgi:SLA1 homology domain 1, SHD1
VQNLRPGQRDLKPRFFERIISLQSVRNDLPGETPMNRTSPRPTALIAICLMFLALATPDSSVGYQTGTVSVTDSQERSWTSLDGKFSVTGVLVAVDGDKIRIQSADGKTISASLKKLSATDNEFVAAELTRVDDANPFKVEEENPMSGESGNFLEGKGVLEADISSIQMIELESDRPVDDNSPLWKTPGYDFRAFGIPLESIHVRLEKGRISADGKFFLAMLQNPFGSEYFPSTADKVKRYVEIYSLADGKRVGRFAVPGEHTVVSDIDPSGKVLLGYDTTFSSEPSIWLFTADKAQLVPAASWNAKSSSGMMRPNIQDARFLIDGKIVVNEYDSLTIWDGKSAKGLYRVELAGNNWQLASDRRTALLSGTTGRYEVDLIEGKTLASMQATRSADVISPDKKHSVEFDRQVVTVRDMEGNVIDEFFIPVNWPQAIVSWVDDRTLSFVLPFSTFFIDIPHRVAMLELSGAGSHGQQSGEGFSENKETGRSGFSIRISPVKTTEPGIGKIDLESWRRRLPDADSLLLFAEGDRVSLSVEFLTEQETAADAERRVREILQDRGVEIDDNARDKLILHTSESTEQVEYQSFGTPPWSDEGSETVNVRRVNRTIRLERDGKVVWSVFGGNGGASPILMLSEGETAQQAVDRQTGNPGDFWKTLSLPKNVAIHPGGGAWATERAR